MKSISKTPVTIDQARAIAKKHFFQPIAAFDELSDGFFNAAYCIELANGKVCVLKVAPPQNARILRYEQNIMEAEVRVLGMVRGMTEMPVPAILAHDQSHSILPVDYFIMTFVPGVSFWNLRKELSETEQQAIEREMGRYLRQMNSITGKRFGYFAAEKHFDSWVDCFDNMLANVLQDGQDANVALPMPYADILTLMRSKYDSLTSVTTPKLVHWDLWDGNIFIDPTSRNITGIIDFERALWGDPLMEVNFGGLGDQPNFRAGYGIDLLSAPGADMRKILYNLYLYLIMVIECTYRQYETQDQENWTRGLLEAELEKLQSMA